MAITGTTTGEKTRWNHMEKGNGCVKSVGVGGWTGKVEDRDMRK